MVTLRAIAQQIENMCQLSNTYYRDGEIVVSMMWDARIKSGVDMAYTCGYACTVYADPLTKEYCMIRVYDLQTEEVYKRVLQGFGYMTLYNDKLKIVHERKPH